MKFPVFKEHADPGVDASEFRINKSTAEGWVQHGHARMIDPQDLKKGLQLTGKARHEERRKIIHELRIGHLVPFSRVQNPLLKPDSINYPIPASGDHRIRWMISFMTPEKKVESVALAG